MCMRLDLAAATDGGCGTNLPRALGGLREFAVLALDERDVDFEGPDLLPPAGSEPRLARLERVLDLDGVLLPAPRRLLPIDDGEPDPLAARSLQHEHIGGRRPTVGVTPAK